jgi:hypothetical protein
MAVWMTHDEVTVPVARLLHVVGGAAVSWR